MNGEMGAITSAASTRISTASVARVVAGGASAARAMGASTSGMSIKDARIVPIICFMGHFSLLAIVIVWLVVVVVVGVLRRHWFTPTVSVNGRWSGLLLAA